MVEYRKKYEQFHKCSMLQWGIVHHKDGHWHNNNIENLEGMTYENHVTRHRELKKLHNQRCSPSCKTSVMIRKGVIKK